MSCFTFVAPTQIEIQESYSAQGMWWELVNSVVPCSELFGNDMLTGSGNLKK
jgi:hypothetical protein